jgi:hypothetical protein
MSKHFNFHLSIKKKAYAYKNYESSLASGSFMKCNKSNISHKKCLRCAVCQCMCVCARVRETRVPVMCARCFFRHDVIFLISKSLNCYEVAAPYPMLKHDALDENDVMPKTTWRFTMLGCKPSTNKMSNRDI